MRRLTSQYSYVKTIRSSPSATWFWGLCLHHQTESLPPTKATRMARRGSVLILAHIQRLFSENSSADCYPNKRRPRAGHALSHSFSLSPRKLLPTLTVSLSFSLNRYEFKLPWAKQNEVHSPFYLGFNERHWFFFIFLIVMYILFYWQLDLIVRLSLFLLESKNIWALNILLCFYYHLPYRIFYHDILYYLE